MTSTPGGATERPWGFGKFFHCDECAANNENYTWRIHNANGKEIARHGFDESLAALIVAAVNSYNPSPDSVEFSEQGKCPLCAGWMMSAYGETPGKHTADCLVAKALAAGG